MGFYGIPFESQLLIYQFDSLTGATDGDWHFDTFYPEMKALLLLQDVDERSGPTAYLRGTHRLHAFRLRHEFFGYRKHRKLRFFSPADLSPWLEREVFLCGQAGTLIIFDGRGLHRPTAQQGSPRSFLMNYLVRA
jgi:hypothetical protein